MSNQILVCDCITLFRLTLIKNYLSVKTYKYECETKLHTTTSDYKKIHKHIPNVKTAEISL